MAKVSQTGAGKLRGKLGGIVYAEQKDGTVTARSVGVRTTPATAGEIRGQNRMKLGNGYVTGVMGDPVLRSAYEAEASIRRRRACNVAMADFMTDPVIANIDPSGYTGQPGGSVLIVTGDDFKVVRVRVGIRDADGALLQVGSATRSVGTGRLWVYRPEQSLAPGQSVILEVTATDWAGHSTQKLVAHCCP